MKVITDAGIPVIESVGDNGEKSHRLDPSAARADIAFSYVEISERRFCQPLFWR